MFTLCYYAAINCNTIMLPLEVYHAIIILLFILKVHCASTM